MKTVLVVDDEPDILASMEQLISVFVDDAEVVGAPSAEKALEILDDMRPDLIVSDYKMPGLNGLELLATASKKVPGVPQIMMSAFRDKSLEMQAADLPDVVAFLGKPLNVDEFEQLLSKHLA